MVTGTRNRTAAGSLDTTVTPPRETTLWHSQAHMPSVKKAERVIVRGEGAYV